MKSTRMFTGVSLVLALMLGAGYVCAQGIDGTLRGEVRDPSDALVPGVAVTVTNDATGETRSQLSSSAGTFDFPHLLVGRYTLAAELAGFRRYARTNIDVKANQVVGVGVRLEVGAPEETVEVVAGGELVQTTTTQLAATFDPDVITRVPVRSTFPINPGEDGLFNLAILEPGVTSQPGGVVGEGGAIGGNRPRNNNFTLDGIDNNRVDVTGHSQTVIDEAVADFTILTNQFTAEYGHSTAGQFIVTTKSGTNNLHGSAWYSVNNRNFNALESVTKAAVIRGDLPGKPRFDWNRAGASLGGPIIKDKWFFYGAYQYTTLGQAAVPGAATRVPTAAGFATLDRLAGSAGSGVSRTMVDILKNNLSPALVPGGTVDVIRDDTGSPEPVELGILTPSAPDFFNEHDYIINSDWQTSRNRLSGRYLSQRIRLPDVPAFPLAQFIGDTTVDAWSVTLSDVFTPTPTFTNELRAGYRRFVQAFTLPEKLVKPATLDIFPNFVVNEANLDIGPPNTTPQSTLINTYQVVEQISRTMGSHIFKAGVDTRWWIAPSEFLPRGRGEYTYSTLNSYIKDLLPDGSNGGLRGVGTGLFAGNQKAIYWFVQDDWKVHPRLTLNLGLRYEYTSNPRDTALQERNSIASVPGVIEFRRPKVDKNNWAPRIGLAWDPTGDRKTSVRAGFAIAYDVVFQNLPLLQLPPQFQQELNLETACAFPQRPAYCATGRGFIAGGGLPFVPLPPTTPEAARAATGGIMGDQVSPTTYTWSLAIQREVAPDTLLETRYVGNRGLKLPVQVQRNVGVVPPDALFLPTYFSTSEIPATVPATAPNLQGFLNARRRKLAGAGFVSNLTAFDPVGNSFYHGWSWSLERRMNAGVWVKTAYTWSKTIDDSTNDLFTSVVNPRRPQDHFDLRNERGLSPLDRPHKFTFAMRWELPRTPFEHGFLKGLLNGWEFSPNYIAESGQPITPLSFIDSNGNFDSAGDRTIVNPNGLPRTGTDVSFVCRSSAGATSVAPSVTACGGNAGVVGYVARDPAAKYVRAQVGAKPNAGRNTERGAGINNWNLVLSKRTFVTEETSVEFRVEFLNAFNHQQPSLGNGSVFIFTDNARELGFSLVDPRVPNFLQPENIFTGGNRSIIFGLKVAF